MKLIHDISGIAMGSSQSTAGSHGLRRAPNLPIECLLLIFQHCPGSTLKTIRLSSKSFARLVEPLLWRDLRLVPNLDALGSIKQLVKHSTIACFVQNLIYDTSWEHLIDDFRLKADKSNLKEKHSPTPGKEKYSCSKVLLHAVRNQIKSGEDAAAEVACLTPLLLALPNLRELSIKESSASFELTEHMPFFYRRVCRDASLSPNEVRLQGGLSPMGNSSSHTRNFLLAAYSTGYKYEYIDLAAVSWHTFFRAPADISQGSQTLDFKVRQILFSGLKQLDLDFKGSPSRDLESNLVPLRDLLRSCERLEGLSLSFSSLVNRRYGNDHRSFSFLVPLLWTPYPQRPLLPRLRDLFLSSLFCTPKDLVQLLVMHSSTLRHVSLSNISLLRNEMSDSRGCWVQVIKDMKALLRLQTVYFSGWLSNGGRQIWHVSQDASENDRLRPKVVQYILNNSVKVCPLEYVAVCPDAEDVERPSSGWWPEGDWTWTMISANSKIRDQTYSGSIMFSKDVPLDSDGWAFANPHFWKTPYQKTYPTYTSTSASKKPSPIPSDPWSDWGASSSWGDLEWKTNDKLSQTSDPWDIVDAAVAEVDSFGWPLIPAQGNVSISHSLSQSSASSAGSSQSISESPPHATTYFSDITMHDFPPPPPASSTHTYPKTWPIPSAETWKFSSLNPDAPISNGQPGKQSADGANGLTYSSYSWSNTPSGPSYSNGAASVGAFNGTTLLHTPQVVMDHQYAQMQAHVQAKKKALALQAKAQKQAAVSAQAYSDDWAQPGGSGPAMVNVQPPAWTGSTAGLPMGIINPK